MIANFISDSSCLDNKIVWITNLGKNIASYAFVFVAIVADSSRNYSANLTDAGGVEVFEVVPVTMEWIRTCHLGCVAVSSNTFTLVSIIASDARCCCPNFINI